MQNEKIYCSNHIHEIISIGSFVSVKNESSMSSCVLYIGTVMNHTGFQLG